MKESLYDIFSDELGQLDFGRAGGGGGLSKAKQVQAFIKVCHRKSQQKRSNLFTVAEMKEVADGLGIERFNTFLDGLNQQAYLLKKSNNSYALQSSEFD